MNELTIASFLILQDPTLPPEQLQDIADLHDTAPVSVVRLASTAVSLHRRLASDSSVRYVRMIALEAGGEPILQRSQEFRSPRWGLRLSYRYAAADGGAAALQR